MLLTTEVGCGLGKIRHSTWLSAEWDRQRIYRSELRRCRARAERLNVYRCEACGGYHVGHMPARRKRA